MKVIKASSLFIVFCMQLILIGKADAKTLTLGVSKIIVPHGALIGTQVDRVIRDIAWTGSDFDEKIDPSRIPATKDQLVPYMEGRLSALLMEYADARVEGLGPCEAIREGEEVIADDGKGNFCFPVDKSKTQYKTAKNVGSGRMILPDTHGFNMIAGLAIKHSKKDPIHTVVACMDLQAKAQAALYLAENGINCYGPCDRHGFELIGYRDKYKKAAVIIGTAPIRALPGGQAVIGDQKIDIDTNEAVVVQNTTFQTYPYQYSDVPYRYFTTLNEKYTLNMKLVVIQANPGEAEKVVAEAVRIHATVIAVRVWDEADAKAVSKWLEKSVENRAVLFHTAIYYQGYLLFEQFPKQTSFGDFSPVIR